MTLLDLSRPEPRMHKPVLIRLSKTDRKQLEKLARRTKTPISTLAYRAVRRMLDSEYGEGGAQ